ncbi:hypothetical protein IM792_02445 [Mucilaginibacter sp. JRF]|uniref:hypothetical protein n=1 Tax=Mucilaginibacter sp. JRF TaxID=2780088 RepID=UPI0018804CA5|nr:hypothetical protein [Mucilaginibacter sp. JRF]MBE9583298.1 hypothetical protein [Mucilaginibacter sp. JRF]
MDSEHFEAFWWPTGQGGSGKLLVYEKQFYVCLKLNMAQKPTLIFCCSKDLEWDDNDTGYLLSFNKPFFPKGVWCNFEGIHLFKNINPISIELEDEDVKTLSPIFDKVFNSVELAYIYKYDLIRTYIFQIIHLSIKIHLQRTDIVKSPIRYARLTTCGIDMFVRIKLGHKQ